MDDFDADYVVDAPAPMPRRDISAATRSSSSGASAPRGGATATPRPMEPSAPADYGRVTGGLIGDGAESGKKAKEEAAGGDYNYRGEEVDALIAPTQPTSTAEQYTHYGINDMTLTERDRHSTFSIDVDTASYSISRRKLNSGALPPTAAVRVEEFVNSFDYSYAPPGKESSGAPFAVHMEAAPSPFDSTHHILRVGVKGAEVDASDRKPVKLTFLVDTSGSMSTMDKIGLAKESMSLLVNNLGPEDSVAIATYAGSTAVVLEPTPASKKSVILSAIENLGTGGGTAMGSGMEMAYHMASEHYAEGAENRVIVLSDGDANIGRTSHDEILRTVTQYAEEGITLSTIGFGMGNYKDTMMEQLANKGDGNYYYIDSRAEAEEVFGEDLAGTLQVIAKDVKIQVEFNPDAVMAYRLIGYENRDIADKDFRNDRVDAGEIGAGHTVTALYDVILKDGYHDELATVRLRAKKPGRDSAAKEWATSLQSDYLVETFDQASADFRLAVGAGTFAELLRGSPYAAEITYSMLYELVEDTKPRDPQVRELMGLIRVAGDLSGERGAVAWR
ncbi:MAG: VWA domain-containing protein [Alphaproteobacteria bacterium]|nr:VWA domain-containing protein [Alphaproteobacteria bacterium]MCB9794481.1 VWA domain-containing protein [Alphaproteobacteria bacterium]